MGWRVWNRMIVVSSSLAAAGILVCIAAMLNALVPKGSILGYAGWTVGLAAAAILVAGGYMWVCDKCEDYLSERLDRLLAKGSRKPPVEKSSAKEPPELEHAHAAQPSPAAPGLRGRLRDASAPLPTRDPDNRHPENQRRGNNKSGPPAASQTSQWRGQ